MPEEQEIREELRSWLHDTWDPEMTLREWWTLLADAGWAVPTWPTEWFGRGLPRKMAAVVAAELREIGAPGPPAGLGIMLAGPTILDHGTDEQKERYLRPIVTGAHAWCQLFSEPGAGSDLASLQTRAVRDGDEWVVTGQKVWTSGARTADRGMLLARVDLDAPKHKGLGYFIIEVDQPGIEIRPLKQMTGAATFNEVLFTEARVAHADLIGRAGDGWAAAVTTLAHERGGRAGAVGVTAGLAGGGGRAELLARKVGDVVEESRRAPRRAASGPNASAVDIRNPGNAGPTSPLTLIQAHARQDDLVLRDDVTRYYIQTRVNTFNQQRSRAEAAAGKSPGPASSITKLARSVATRMNRDLGPRILGPAGTLSGDDAPHGGAVCQSTLQAPSTSIAGGTDEIQHNIIGERVLALPKEPEPERDLPFRELKVGTQRSEAR